MLRMILASAAALAIGAGAANAQGAAGIGEYHERFAVDSDPRDRVTRPDIFTDRGGLAADPLFEDIPVAEETVVISRSPVVVRRSAAAIPGRAHGMTPGAPLGSDPMSDQKVVAGGR